MALAYLWSVATFGFVVGILPLILTDTVVDVDRRLFNLSNLTMYFLTGQSDPEIAMGNPGSARKYL